MYAPGLGLFDIPHTWSAGTIFGGMKKILGVEAGLATGGPAGALQAGLKEIKGKPKPGSQAAASAAPQNAVDTMTNAQLAILGFSGLALLIALLARKRRH